MRRIVLAVPVMMLVSGGGSFFLNEVAYSQLRHALPFAWNSDRLSFFPGRLRLDNFRVDKASRFKVHARQMTLRYGLAEFLLGAKLTLSLTGRDFDLKLAGRDAEASLPDFHFDFVSALLEVGTDRKIHVNYFFAQGDQGHLYLSGILSAAQLNLNLTCFLAEKTLRNVPEFIAENLFAQGTGPLNKIQLKAEGSWERPIFYASSDLVTLAVKGREV